MQQPDMNVVITEKNKMMIKIIKKAYQTVAGRIRDGDGMLNIFLVIIGETDNYFLNHEEENEMNTGLNYSDNEPIATSFSSNTDGVKNENDITDFKVISGLFKDEFEDEGFRLEPEFNDTDDDDFDFPEIDFEDDEWMKELETDKNGAVKTTAKNFMLILRNDRSLQGIAYNQFIGRVGIRDTNSLPWNKVKPGWNDSDQAALAMYIGEKYKIFNLQMLKTAVLASASEKGYHPIKERFEALPDWDGTERLDTVLVDYLGAEDNSYTRAVTRKTIVAAVARIHKPGIKYDQLLTLVGDQGVGKSTLLSKLGGEYYSDSLTINDMKDKAAPEKLQGYLILEISELNGFRKADAETVKSFLSRQDDIYRPSYGTNVESHPRQSIVVGTTNQTSGFLRDTTGNRRIWPLYVSGESDKKPWDLDQDTVDQIWAEALYRYRNGEELILDHEEAKIAFDLQRQAMESDDREGLVKEYLDTRLPAEKDWNKMSLSERRLYLSKDEFTLKKHPAVRLRDKVCNMEIWVECLGKDGANMKKQDSSELSTIMAKISGWKKYDGSNSGKLSFAPYGSQHAYVRTDSNSLELDLESFFSED